MACLQGRVLRDVPDQLPKMVVVAVHGQREAVPLDHRMGLGLVLPPMDHHVVGPLPVGLQVDVAEEVLGQPRLRQKAQTLVPGSQLLVRAGGQADSAPTAHKERVKPHPDRIPDHLRSRLPGERQLHVVQLSDGDGAVVDHGLRGLGTDLRWQDLVSNNPLQVLLAAIDLHAAVVEAIEALLFQPASGLLQGCRVGLRDVAWGDEEYGVAGKH
mmetsp:Transcript_42219/g.75615  ORF Transcript_42219/g.75615 Transcript_42219/m.75615 type:complete len:213 (+) Transcript_42219:129-767(+)